MDLKEKLIQLIKKSPTLTSLSEEEKKFRANAMLNSSEESKQKFITILENEASQMKKIDDDFAQQAGEIQGLMAEAKQLEKEAETLFRKDEEAFERVGDEDKANQLLAELDKIQDEK